jgi:hypothetical protein
MTKGGKKKATRRMKAARRTKPAATFTITHRGAGQLVRTATGVELRLHSSEQEAVAAGMPPAIAARLFIHPPHPLCTVRYTKKVPKGFDDLLDPIVMVDCLDTGCSKKPNHECILNATPGLPEPPGPAPIPMLPDHVYFCECTEVFSD